MEAARVFQGGQRLSPADVSVTILGGLQWDISAQPDVFRVVKWPIRPRSSREEIRLVARLQVPPGKYCPPVSCYIRRPYIDRR